MSKRFKTRGIKGNKTYTVEELADVAGVSIPTVRNWLKIGMKRLDDQRPTMIIGFQALEFINARKANSKKPMALGEFYCLRCKAARKPLGGMADYAAISATGGRLKALCSVCECACNLNISARKFDDFAKVLDIAVQNNSQ